MWQGSSWKFKSTKTKERPKYLTSKIITQIQTYVAATNTVLALINIKEVYGTLTQADNKQKATEAS